MRNIWQAIAIRGRPACMTEGKSASPEILLSALRSEPADARPTRESNPAVKLTRIRT
jgi:hypothetical protein